MTLTIVVSITVERKDDPDCDPRSFHWSIMDHRIRRNVLGTDETRTGPSRRLLFEGLPKVSHCRIHGHGREIGNAVLPSGWFFRPLIRRRSIPLPSQASRHPPTPFVPQAPPSRPGLGRRKSRFPLPPPFRGRAHRCQSRSWIQSGRWSEM
jgi:hypothetical protein